MALETVDLYISDELLTAEKTTVMVSKKTYRYCKKEMIQIRDKDNGKVGTYVFHTFEPTLKRKRQ